MTKLIIKKLKAVRSIGLFRFARISLDRAFLGILARIFKFHPWHAASPTSARPYRRTIAYLVNSLKPGIVVEVGCGLGEILRLVKAPARHGYDIDGNVIKAARFLHGSKISFHNGDLGCVVEQRIDVLILVNWIHEISPDALEQYVTPLLSRTNYVVLDAIDPDGPDGYRYKHDFHFLTQKAEVLSVTRPPNEGRRFYLFKVCK